MTDRHQLISSTELLTGADLKNARKATKMSQGELADRAGVSRDTVCHWECKARVSVGEWGVQQILRVLAPDRLLQDRVSISDHNARAGGWGDINGARNRAIDDYVERVLAADRQRAASRENARRARLRVLCGAETRKGCPCRNKSEPGKLRCKFHGGKSTGARTPEGIARIVEAQQRRWARYRAERVTSGVIL